MSRLMNQALGFFQKKIPLWWRVGVVIMYQIRNELLGAGLSTMVQVRTYSKNSI